MLRDCKSSSARRVKVSSEERKRRKQRAKLNGIAFSFSMKRVTYNTIIKKLKKLVPCALLSYISTREFLRTREKCGEARAECEGECFSHFSNVLKNSRVLI